MGMKILANFAENLISCGKIQQQHYMNIWLHQAGKIRVLSLKCCAFGRKIKDFEIFRKS